MAGDWILMRTDLPDDPAVIGAAIDLGIPQEQVVGLLLRFWGWVDHHVSSCNARVTLERYIGNADGNAGALRDCVATCVTPDWVDRYLRVDGFAEAIARQGWLVVHDGEVFVPDFDRYFDKSAKKRLLTRERVRRHRERGNADVTLERYIGNADGNAGALLQNRREENRTEKSERCARASEEVEEVEEVEGTSELPESVDPPDRDLWHELQRPPFNFRSSAKILGIVERGTTPEELDRWRAYGRAHGVPAAVAGIQAFRTPEELSEATRASERDDARAMIERSLRKAREGGTPADTGGHRRSPEGGPR